jgi:hypothetical protein
LHVGGNVVHTGQLYFDDAVSDAVYTQDPYSHPNRDTTNASDGIFQDVVQLPLSSQLAGRRGTPSERGIIVSYEAVRHWCYTFGPGYAADLGRHPGRSLPLTTGSARIFALTAFLAAVALHNLTTPLVQPR